MILGRLHEIKQKPTFPVLQHWNMKRFFPWRADNDAPFHLVNCCGYFFLSFFVLLLLQQTAAFCHLNMCLIWTSAAVCNAIIQELPSELICFDAYIKCICSYLGTDMLFLFNDQPHPPTISHLTTPYIYGAKSEYHKLVQIL